MKRMALALMLAVALPLVQGGPSLSAEEHHYLSAADLEVECSKKSETCYGVIYGVLGSLLYLNNTEQMKEVLCLPAISAEDIRLHFLSYAIDNRKGIAEMLGGAALAGLLWDKYPCPKERLRRRAEGEKAYKEMEDEARGRPPKD
jgi:hypothetical protein